MAEALKYANPNFSRSNRYYSQNCQRCVYAYEALRRGYDVEALPTFKGDVLPSRYSQSKVDEWRERGYKYVNTSNRLLTIDEYEEKYKGNGWLDVMSGIENAMPSTRTRDKMVKNIEAKMSEWGNGSRAIVRVEWNETSGHVFIAEQENDKTKFIDPQSANDNYKTWIDHCKPSKTELFRIDDKEFTDLIGRCIKERDKNDNQ